MSAGSALHFGWGTLQRFIPFFTAIACVGLAFLIRFALTPILDGRFALLMLLLAVVASSYIAGPWSAFFATILSFAVALVYFIEPAFGVLPIAGPDLVGLVAFLIIGVMIAMLSGRMSLLQRRATRDAEERADQIVRMAGQLQLADRLTLIGTLTAGLTHDIGNILMPLRSRLDAVEQELKTHSLHSEHVELMQSAAEHLASLSRGLSQLVAQPDELSATPTNLHEWADSVDRVLRIALPRTVALSLNVPSDMPPVKIAPHALSQAVFNLVHNSGKAINNSAGHITIDAEHDAERRIIRIMVRDDGPGMSEKTLRRLGELTPSTREEGNVCGVGLRLVQSIITAAGGSLQLRSENGYGTEVCLSLPTAEEQPTIIA